MPDLVLFPRINRTTGSVVKLVSALLVACMPVFAIDDAFAHGVTLKTRHGQSTDSAFHKSFLLPWAHKIHEESSGKVNLLIAQGDSSSDDSATLFQMVKDRTADIVWLNVAGPTADFPRFSVFSLPLADSQSEGASRALWAYADEYDLAFREFSKMRLLAVSRHDAPLFHMRDKKIASLSDLAGTRIAIPNSETSHLLIQLGASPVVMPLPAMRDALATAKIDGVLLSWSSLTALKLEDLLKTHSALPAGAPLPYAEVSALVMNRDAYRSLGDDLKQAMKNNSGAETSALLGRVFATSAAGARQRAADRGDTVTVLPAEELPKWQIVTGTAIEKRIAELEERKLGGKNLVKKARTLLSEFGAAK